MSIDRIGEEELIEETVKYLSQCPYLADAGIKVNYLEGKPTAFALRLKATSPVVKQYTDGGGVFEARFILALRQEYSGADKYNRVAAKRCEDIERWIAQQNQAGNLPDLGQEISPLSLTVAKSFDAKPSGSVDARFEAEIRLVYLKL